jgi:hypothetical protein
MPSAGYGWCKHIIDVTMFLSLLGVLGNLNKSNEKNIQSISVVGGWVEKVNSSPRPFH